MKTIVRIVETKRGFLGLVTTGSNKGEQVCATDECETESGTAYVVLLLLQDLGKIEFRTE